MHLPSRSPLRLVATILVLTSPAAIAARPGALNTGPTSAESELTRASGLSISEAGTVVDGVYVTGAVNISASNVILRNFKIETSGSYGVQITGGATNVLLEDGEISGMSSAGVYGGNFTARRLHVHDSGNDAFKPSGNAVIEDSWVERLGYISDSHSDGVQMVSGRNVTIRGNNFDMANQPGFTNSQVLIIQTNNGPIDNILIEGNWINGGGYSVQVRDKDTGYGAPTNVRMKSNRFGRDYQFGPWVLNGNVELCGNVWDDTNILMSNQNVCGDAPPQPTPPTLIGIQ